MPKITVALNLNVLTCNETCIGPGSDTITLTSRVDDITDRNQPVLIKGTDAKLGPYQMDTKKHIQAGKPGVFTVGQTPFFRALDYTRTPPASGVWPDNILLTVTVIKGDAVVDFSIPLEITFNGGKIGISIPVGKGIAKIIDLFENQTIGEHSDVIDNTKAAPPNGQKFVYDYTGDGSNYHIEYSLTAKYSP